MAKGDEPTRLYSIQKTYILTPALKSGKAIVTCNQRIDIPTIEPLLTEEYDSTDTTITVPCIELAGDFLEEYDLMFETNEGITVLPAKISPKDSPYGNFRYVLVLPRGATGVKSCKIIHKPTGIELQHNFTFGIMPPPYNYDNALFGILSDRVAGNSRNIGILEDKVNDLKLTTKTPTFASIDLPRGEGKQTINIEDGVLFYNTSFSYPLSPETTIHNPKITLHGGGRDQVYTLSLNKATNTVSIDLFTGMITVYAGVTGEIMQQFKLAIPYKGFETLSFDDYYDIDDPFLHVYTKGARVE